MGWEKTCHLEKTKCFSNFFLQIVIQMYLSNHTCDIWWHCNKFPNCHIVFIDNLAKNGNFYQSILKKTKIGVASGSKIHCCNKRPEKTRHTDPSTVKAQLYVTSWLRKTTSKSFDILFIVNLQIDDNHLLRLSNNDNMTWQIEHANDD